MKEQDFKRTVRVKPLANDLADANIIASHTMFKRKGSGDQMLMLKSRLAQN